MRWRSTTRGLGLPLPLLVMLALAWGCFPAEAQRFGSCADPDYPLALDVSGLVDDPRPLRVLVDKASVFPNPGAEVASAVLEFGEIVFANRWVQQQEAWIEVEPIDSEPLGWVRADELLCTSRPLRNLETRLERRLFINTESSETVSAYPDPVQGVCNGGCRSMSRFQLYFVFAEDHGSGRLLLSSSNTLTEARDLVGWIDHQLGIEWNTARAIRPRDDAEIQGGWTSLERASDGAELDVAVQGGAQWRDFALRPPILGESRFRGADFYRISAPGVGLLGFEDPPVRSLESLRTLDVFYLLDGSQGMSAYLEGARASAREIAERVASDPGYRETHVRFGFRIYNLDPGETRTLGENSPIPGSDCAGEQAESNWTDFETGLESALSQLRAKTQSPKHDANLYAALSQALVDLAPCPSRTKVLLVVGSAGDASDLIPEDLLRQLESLEHPPLVFFAQPPGQPEADRPSDGSHVGDRFRAQAEAFVDHAFEGLRSESSGGLALDPSDHVFVLNAGELPETLAEVVGRYSRSDTINEIIERLRKGQSLESVLGRLAEYGDHPLVYLERIHSAACEELGDQCSRQVRHGMSEFFVPTADVGWQEEVWLSRYQIDRWIRLLTAISDSGSYAGGIKTRRRLVDALSQQLEVFSGVPVAESGQTLAELLEPIAGIPTRPDSPLLQYGFEDILYWIAPCELERLIAWASASRDLLLSIEGNPTLEPQFELEQYPAGDCPYISPKGSRIPRVVFGEPKSLGTNSATGAPYSFRSVFQEEIRYWIPIEYLP